MTAPADRTAEPRAVHAPAPPPGAEPTLVAPVPGVGSPTPAAVSKRGAAAGPDPISRWGGEGGPDRGKGGPPKPRKRRPKDIGTAAETAVVRYLQANGWPGAERRALRGTSDAGDITGTPGVAWEVKGGEQARSASDKQISAWLDELAAEKLNAGADTSLLVVQRRGVGAANAGRWWALTPAYQLEGLMNGTGRWHLGARFPVRMILADAVQLLRSAGYGDPLEDS